MMQYASRHIEELAGERRNDEQANQIWQMKECFLRLLDFHGEMKRNAAHLADISRTLFTERDRTRRMLLLGAARKQAAALFSQASRYRLQAEELLCLASEMPEPTLTCPDDVHAYHGQQCLELLQRWLAKIVDVYVNVRRRQARLLAEELSVAAERMNAYLIFIEQTLIEDLLEWIV